MPVLFARPVAANYTKAGDQAVHHVIKLLEAPTLSALQDAVNQYLFNLESVAGEIYPAHVQDIEISHYETDPPQPTIMHVAKIHLIPIGDIPT